MRTKITIALILVIAYAFYTALDVFAAPALVTPTDKGPRQNSHVTAAKPAQSCRNWTDNGWIVEIDSYFIDDGQTAESNYSDYLGDFQWYFTQYPGTCKAAPAPMPQ